MKKKKEKCVHNYHDYIGILSDDNLVICRCMDSKCGRYFYKYIEEIGINPQTNEFGCDYLIKKNDNKKNVQ